jgi:hypothetical protein
MFITYQIGINMKINKISIIITMVKVEINRTNITILNTTIRLKQTVMDKNQIKPNTIIKAKII